MSELSEIFEKFLVVTDPSEMKRCVKVFDILNVIWDYDQWLRSKVKYQDDEEAQNYRDKLYEILEEYDVSLEELVR